MSKTKLSVYISFLLRHGPESIGLAMDRHGWVAVAELIEKINGTGKYRITAQVLEEVVRTDNKGRFRYSENGEKIKACQGHSIPWVEPELTCGEPPEYLYHGTTAQAWEQIQACGYISKMGRHAVHLQAEAEKAWQSAKRWRKVPVVLKIDSAAMHADGSEFGISDNGVWCTKLYRSAISCLCCRRKRYKAMVRSSCFRKRKENVAFRATVAGERYARIITQSRTQECRLNGIIPRIRRPVIGPDR